MSGDGHGFGFGGPFTKLLAASVALYLSAAVVVMAVCLLKSIWPWLVGIVVLAGGTWLAIVVIRTRRQHW